LSFKTIRICRYIEIMVEYDLLNVRALFCPAIHNPE
jgi:hypothetical protein